MDDFKRPDAGSKGFLPADYVERKTESRFYALTLALFFTVMLGVVGAFLVTNQRWSAVRSDQRAINAQYEQAAVKLEQLKSLEAQRSQMLDKARVTTALLEPVPRSVLLAEMVTSLPRGVTLVEVKLQSKRIRVTAAAPDPKAKPAASRSLSKPGVAAPTKPTEPPKVEPPRFEYSLTIVGVASDNNQVADYLRLLQRSPLLTSVELLYIAQTTLDTLDLRRFEIVARLRDDADPRQVGNAREVELEALGAPVREPQASARASSPEGE
ncbi:MAG TPA: PilN domain-containing protein [Phycisphaerales bacterium]|nr:PilN domain-containing protein [Phycisphaerales bacterium]